MKQRTIQYPISCYGIGVHSGRKTQITLKPAPDNSGIIFIRTDVSEVDNKIEAKYHNVCDTNLSTTIKNQANIRVETIEHLMAAIWGCGIDNLIIEIDGLEVPIMDGSSKPFIFMIECSGIQLQHSKKRILKILKDITISNGDSELNLIPSEHLVADLTIDFDNEIIGRQNYKLVDNYNHDNNQFKNEVADSRTFGFLSDLEYLKKQGLARGASLDNAIGIDQDIILNHEGLRHKNEFVRHKMLDLLGDLFTAGGNYAFNISGYKTSHALNNQLLHKIFENPHSYQWCSAV